MKQSELLVLEIADMLERNGDKNMSYVSINLLKKELLIIKSVNTTWANFDKKMSIYDYQSTTYLIREVNSSSEKSLKIKK